MAYKHYYPDPQAESSQLSLHAKLLYSGIVKDDPSWFNIPHKHDFCEILYIVHGSGTVILDGTTRNVGEGDLVIVDPEILHEERSDPNDPLNLLFVAVDQFQIGAAQPNHLLPEGACPFINTQKYRLKMREVFADIIQETSNMVMFYSEMSQHLVNMLLLLILRLQMVDTTDPEISEECLRVKKYIDQNYTLPITLEDLSETFYISKHHLAHLFKQQTGTSPIRYMIDRRMEEACHLLSETNYPVSKIATMVGYDNPVYFSQLFKRLKGVSPQSFRKQG